MRSRLKAALAVLACCEALVAHRTLPGLFRSVWIGAGQGTGQATGHAPFQAICEEHGGRCSRSRARVPGQAEDFGKAPPVWCGIVATRQWVRFAQVEVLRGTWERASILVHCHVIAKAKWSRKDGEVGLDPSFFAGTCLVSASLTLDSSTGQYYWLAQDVVPGGKRGDAPSLETSVADLEGAWTGRLVSASVNRLQAPVPMRFELGTPGQDGSRAFTLVYGAPGPKQSVRRYHLVATPKPGRFVLDETTASGWMRRSCTAHSGRASASATPISSSAIGRSAAACSRHSSRRRRSLSTHSGGDGKVPEVPSFAVLSVQRAVLFKQD
jgi:hypothetical protein